MKTILYVFHCSSIGGGSYCLLNILKSIDRSIYKPIVLLATKGALSEELLKLNITVFFLNDLTSVPYNLPLFKKGVLLKYWKINHSIRNFISVVTKISPDIIYFNSMMLYPYLKPAKEKGYKTIIHIREHWPINEHTIQLSWAQFFIQKYADQVIAINHFAYKQIAGIETKTTIIYDWIDLTERYKRISLSEIFQEDIANKKILLFTGGTAPNKGAKEVVEIFSRYIKGDEFRLLILGGANKDYGNTFKDKLKIWLSNKGIKEYYSYKLHKAILNDSRIVCIPNVYEIKDILDQCFCLISYFTIPHANLALAESIINETIAIAAETDESLEYSLNGQLAFLFEMNNPDSFIETFNDLLCQYDQKKADLKEKSRIIRDMFDKDINIQKLNSIYSKI